MMRAEYLSLRECLISVEVSLPRFLFHGFPTGWWGLHHAAQPFISPLSGNTESQLY